MEWRSTYPLLEDAGLETWAIDILGWGFSDLGFVCFSSLKYKFTLQQKYYFLEFVIYLSYSIVPVLERLPPCNAASKRYHLYQVRIVCTAPCDASLYNSSTDFCTAMYVTALEDSHQKTHDTSWTKPWCCSCHRLCSQFSWSCMSFHSLQLSTFTKFFFLICSPYFDIYCNWEMDSVSF